jgi:hypothetical protein
MPLEKSLMGPRNYYSQNNYLPLDAVDVTELLKLSDELCVPPALTMRFVHKLYLWVSLTELISYWLILFKEMTAVYSDNHMKPTNTFCVKNSGLHSVKTDLCNSDMLFSLR